jgi:hypothetical protein
VQRQFDAVLAHDGAITTAALVVKAAQLIRSAVPLIALESPPRWPFGNISAADDLDRTPSPRTFIAIFGASGSLLTVDNSRFAFMKFAQARTRAYARTRTRAHARTRAVRPSAHSLTH